MAAANNTTHLTQHFNLGAKADGTVHGTNTGRNDMVSRLETAMRQATSQTASQEQEQTASQTATQAQEQTTTQAQTATNTAAASAQAAAQTPTFGFAAANPAQAQAEATADALKRVALAFTQAEVDRVTREKDAAIDALQKGKDEKDTEIDNLKRRLNTTDMDPQFDGEYTRITVKHGQQCRIKVNGNARKVEFWPPEQGRHYKCHSCTRLGPHAVRVENWAGIEGEWTIFMLDTSSGKMIEVKGSGHQHEWTKSPAGA